MRSIVIGTLLAVAAAVSDTGAQQGVAAVTGTVRAADTREPIVSALVEVVGTGLRTVTDSLGRYAVSSVSPSDHTLRFSRLGYRSLDVETFTTEGSTLRLDVTLSPEPRELPAMRVSATRRARERPDDRPPRSTDSWQLTTRELRDSPLLPEADVFRALSGSPQVGARPEMPTTLHVRGGSADQNLVLLDGVPVYNAVHAGEVFSALDPHALGSVTLLGATPSAQFGGRLSGVIDVRTRDSMPAHYTARGALGMTALGGAVDLPISAFPGVVRLSARHTYRGAEQLTGERDGVDGWGDALATTTFAAAGNELHLVSFLSSDHVSLGTNHFRWSAETGGVIWRRPAIGGASLETSLWSAGSHAAANWTAEQGALSLESRLRHTGAAGVLAWPRGQGQATVGMSLDRLDTRYEVSGASEAAGTTRGSTLLRRASAALLLSAFAQDRWTLGDRGSLESGVRITALNGAATRFEPRLAISFTPSADLTLSAGYARTHQYMQSLRNEESLVDAVVGIELPVSFGAPGVPIARSDELSATLAAAGGWQTRVSLHAYTRWLGGLVLVAPFTTEPFAVDTFQRGSGRSSGVGVRVERVTDRLWIQGAYAFGTVTRSSGGNDYSPSFAVTHSASVAAAIRLPGEVRVRSAASAIAGRGAQAVTGDVDWRWEDPLYREREISGTPRSVSSWSTERLPLYVRLDVGVRREFNVARRGRGTLIAFLNLDNVTNRRNVLAYRMPRGPAPREAIAMVPPSTTFGIEWEF